MLVLPPLRGEEDALCGHELAPMLLVHDHRLVVKGSEALFRSMRLSTLRLLSPAWIGTCASRTSL